jgi:hypothetical protein
MLGSQDFLNADSREEQEAISEEAFGMSAANAVKKISELSKEDLLDS